MEEAIKPHIKLVLKYLNKYPNNSMNGFKDYLIRYKVKLDLPADKFKSRNFLRSLQNKMKYYGLIEELNNVTDKRFNSMALTSLGQDVANDKTSLEAVVLIHEQNQSKTTLEYDLLLKQNSDYKLFKIVAICGLILSVISIIISLVAAQ